MARFTGIDYYDIDSLLSEEERMIRDTVRAWVDDRVMPIINEAYIGRHFPRELIPEEWASWACSAPTCPKNTAAPA